MTRYGLVMVRQPYAEYRMEVKSNLPHVLTQVETLATDKFPKGKIEHKPSGIHVVIKNDDEHHEFYWALLSHLLNDGWEPFSALEFGSRGTVQFVALRKELNE